LRGFGTCIGNIRGADLFISRDGTLFSSATQAQGVPPVFVALNRVDLKEV
jgi:hypothetical protein